jgi:glycerol-3-phosphate dehydrogenase (NAD(P)+)
VSAPVGIVGAGSFGLGLAHAIVRHEGHAVLWSRRPERRLEHERVHCTTEATDLAQCELVFVAVPSMYVPEVAPSLARALDGRHLLVHVSRGLIGEELQTVSRYLGTHTAARRVGCLAGPINAEVLSTGAPGGGVVGSGFREVAEAVREAIGGGQLRLYDTDDTVGVEVASAMVGLLALAAGFCLESRISPSALATMMNRGLAEAARVGVRLGARAETFQGLAGSGDLYAAMAGDERAELRLGRALARSSDLEAAGREAGAYIEGVTIARRVASHAARLGLDAPIASVIADVLEGARTAEGAMRSLMGR